MQIWTDAEIEFVRKRINKETKEIVAIWETEYGPTRSYDSIQKKVSQLRMAYSPGDNEAAVDTDQEETILVPYGDNIITIPASTKATLKEQRKQWLKDFVETSRLYKPGNIVIPPVQSTGTTLVMALSDVHFGQQNKGYDIETAKKRVGEIPIRLKQATTVKDLDEIVYLMIGDMVEGEDIYPSQPHHIVCSTMEQVEHATTALWKMIRDTRSIFKVPVRVVCVPGNHGARKNNGNSEKTNWDNVLYHALKIVAQQFGDTQIGIECDYEEFKTFTVKDKTGLIYHEGVKHSSTPATREKIAGWVYSKKMQFMCSGHWHEWKVGGWADVEWMANGSLCGPNDLSEKMAQEGPARQGYFYVTAGKSPWGFSFIEWKNKIADEVPSNPKELKQ